MSGPVTLATLKDRLRITDAGDATFLASVVDAVNDWVVSRVGMDLVPSGGTAVRYLDGDGTREVFVPGGIRGFATVETSADGWVTDDDVTASVSLKPDSWRLPPSRPPFALRLSEASGLVFPCGEGTVRVTSSEWGYAAWPARLVEAGETTAVRMYGARVTGQRDIVGSDETGQPVVSRFVSGKDLQTIDGVRWANDDFGYV